MKRNAPRVSIRKSKGIGVQNEKSLHAALKQWYARPGDQLEVELDGFIVDIVRGDFAAYQMTADKTRAACHHRFHGCALLQMSVSRVATGFPTFTGARAARAMRLHQAHRRR